MNQNETYIDPKQVKTIQREIQTDPNQCKTSQNDQKVAKRVIKWAKTTQIEPNWSKTSQSKTQNHPKQAKIFVFSRNKLLQIAELEV